MYQNNSRMFFTNECDISLLCSSKFREILRDISFVNYDISRYKLESIYQLTKLHSVEFTINLDKVCNYFQYDYLSTFNLLPSSLRIFILNISFSFISNASDGLQKLFDAVASITQIEELKLATEDIVYVNNFSFVSSLKNLERLVLETEFGSSFAKSSLITAIRTLPKFKELIQDDYFFTGNNLVFLRQLCAQPNAPSCLSLLPTFYDIKLELQDTFVNLLKELISLKSIQYACTNEYSVSKSLAQLIRGFSISNHVFNDHDIDSIISMPLLNEIHIDECFMTEKQFQRLYKAIGTKLLKLTIFKLEIKSQVLFRALSNCSQLKNLGISLDSEFHNSSSFYLFNLGKCTRLEELRILFTSEHAPVFSKQQTLHDQFKAALNLPSDIIPSLRNVEISIF
jgi:hypothetical protein